MDILKREFIYVWYYFSIQLEQVFFYWVMGMVIGSAISVFGKGKIHSAFQTLGKKKLGVLGLIPASLLGIASPLCMYGTIPIAASFSQKGMKDDMLAAFMMSSILLNPAPYHKRYPRPGSGGRETPVLFSGWTGSGALCKIFI